MTLDRDLVERTRQQRAETLAASMIATREPQSVQIASMAVATIAGLVIGLVFGFLLATQTQPCDADQALSMDTQRCIEIPDTNQDPRL